MFIDNLALTEAFLLFAAAVLTYASVLAWWGIRKNNPESVKAAIRGSAVPVGGIGMAAVILGLWSEMTWPYPAMMGGYNILFNDMTLIFGIVMVTFGVAAYLQLRLQYVGVLAFMAGAVTILYGWTAYGFNYTKEPFDFLLLYTGFGVAGIFALPATTLVDYYLHSVTKSETLWRSATPVGAPGRALGATRAVQKLGVAPAGAAETTEPTILRFRIPVYFELIILAFPVFMALAGLAAWWFLGTTIPGHLTPGATP
jgi:putative membrane protein